MSDITHQSTTILPSGLELTCSKSIADLKSWTEANGDSTFLSPAFYLALEDSPPSGTKFRYGLVSDKQGPLGVVYCQLKTIDLSESLRFENVSKLRWSKRQYTRLKQLLAKQIKYNTMVIGNMTLTGDYGHYFKDRCTDTWSVIREVADQMVTIYKAEGIKVSGVLLKDFEADSLPAKMPEYAKFSVQPNMRLTIPVEWKSFDDYLDAMKSKYKVRVRRARKKAVNLTKVELSADEILQQKDTISALYQCVSDGAGFNLFQLPDRYFYSLKHHLGEDMRLTAYYDGDSMVGFYTSIKNHGELDAHFLGYDPDTNNQSQLYLNMLYDLVEEAINDGCSRLVMSRTALEIKSSVGAEATDMYLYLKATNGLINSILPKALAYFIPEVKWQPRSPFK